MSVNKRETMMAVLSANLNTIPVVPSGTPEAFVETSTTWLSRWWRQREKWQIVSSGYCALICYSDFSTTAAFKDFELVELFREAFSSTMGGAIYVTDAVLGKVYRKRGTFSDANAIVKEINAIGLEENPTVLFEPEIGTLLLAEGGVKRPSRVIQLGQFSPALTVENVDKQLNTLYVSSLKYPTNFPQIWFNSEKFIPIFEAEKLFQSTALIHLRAVAQDTWFVRPEDDNNAGRTDLTISTLNPRCVFVLEIKILKSFKYNAKSRCIVCNNEENESWADGGITQVINYREAQEAHEAFLLLYDLRQNDEEIPSIIERCDKENVLPRRYFIYNATARKINAKRKS